MHRHGPGPSPASVLIDISVEVDPLLRAQRPKRSDLRRRRRSAGRSRTMTTISHSPAALRLPRRRQRLRAPRSPTKTASPPTRRAPIPTSSPSTSAFPLEAAASALIGAGDLRDVVSDLPPRPDRQPARHPDPLHRGRAGSEDSPAAPTPPRSARSPSCTNLGSTGTRPPAPSTTWCPRPGAPAAFAFDAVGVGSLPST